MSSETKSVTDISLRPVAAEDHEFLVTVYGSTRADEMAMVPWTDEQRDAFVRSQFKAQGAHYEKSYPTANHDIILASGKPVGRLYVARLENEIRIVDITVLPLERGAGIGTYLIKALLEESERTNKITQIYVEDYNPSLSLFKRLGFSVGEQQGFHLLMQWNPKQGLISRDQSLT